MNNAANWLLVYEISAMMVMVIAFWFEDYNRLWSLLLLPPILVGRWLVHKRVLTIQPLTPWLGVFIVLGVINVVTAPFSRGMASLHLMGTSLAVSLDAGWVMLGRPLMGIALVITLVEHARTSGKMRGILIISLGLAWLIGILALGSSQWTSKSDMLRPIIDLIPLLRGFPGAERGFNPNEIAGALSFVTPLMAGLALIRWPWRMAGVFFAATFWLLFLALFLGQSRLALIGVTVSLALLSLLMLPSWPKRALAIIALIVFVGLEISIVTNLFAPQDRQAAMQVRDEDSAIKRFDMWSAALNIVQDYPFTGVGMNMFKTQQVRIHYPVPTYENRILPHAHNEFIQIAADLGIPGFAVFTAWYGAIAWMIWRCWRLGDARVKGTALAAGAGILAHAIFGMGDAIALWDRFTFVFWWLLGVASAQFALVAPTNEAAVAEATPRTAMTT